MLRTDPRFIAEQGVWVLSGNERLIAPTLQRRGTDPSFRAHSWEVAARFTEQLVARCPWVKVVLVSGSLGGEAFVPSDDIDLNLVVEDGSKYLTYALALAGAAQVALRERLPEGEGSTQLPLLRKVICLNVIWEEQQTLPFERMDPYLGFELLLCRPLFGAERWRRVLAANPWLSTIFPQLLERRWQDIDAGTTLPLRRYLLEMTADARSRASLEAAARAATTLAHRYVNAGRARYRPEVLARIARMERYKFPYGFFQEAMTTPADVAPPLE